MLEHIDRWLEQWRKPIWDALYRRDESGARAVLEQAITAWDSYDSTADIRAAMRMYLDFLSCQIDESFKPIRDIKRGILLDCAERIAAVVDLPLVHIMRARVLLTLRCWAHVQSVHPLARLDADRWYVAVPVEDRDHQMMSYVAFWAFTLQEMDYLREAYHYFVTQPVNFMVDFSRQRAKVMLMLAENRFARQDIVKLIDLAPHLMHLQWIGRHIAAHCMSQQQWDNQLQAQLDEKVRRLRDTVPHAPLRDVPVGFDINI